MRQTNVDAVLAPVLELGQDRPDNAQLIQQSGARWLRSDTIGSISLDVIQGPTATASSAGGSLTYWIDDTGHLFRVEAHLGGGSSASRIEIDANRFTPFPPAAQLPD